MRPEASWAHASWALIGLGSNLGDRAGQIREACRLLAESPGVKLRSVSTLRETQPEGAPGQAAAALGPPYLNAAVEVTTTLEPRALLDLCLGIEARLGRERSTLNAPRTVDLDLLLYGVRVIREEGLEVPHPRLLERGFVLEPLAEIAPDRRHPLTGRTFREHWQEWRRSREDHR